MRNLFFALLLIIGHFSKAQTGSYHENGADYNSPLTVFK